MKVTHFKTYGPTWGFEKVWEQGMMKELGDLMMRFFKMPCALI
jgi:hypothetical protein